MMAHGSAFRRTVMNAPDKAVLKNLSDAGNIDDLAKEVQTRSVKHTVGTCQWYLNRSVKALTTGPVNHHEAAFNLAAVVAAGSVAKDAKNLSMPIDKNAFSQAIQATMASKDFQRMVNRYETDPNYRQNINGKLTQNGGAIVSQELYKYEHESAKKAAQAQPQANRPAQVQPQAQP